MLKHNKPSKDPNEVEYLNDIKKALDDSLNHLDPSTNSRLQAIRKNAIDQYINEQKQSGKWPNWVLPAGGFASIVLAVVLSVGLWQSQKSDQNIMAILEDIPLLTGDEDLEIYEELEFYQWLADEQSAG